MAQLSSFCLVSYYVGIDLRATSGSRHADLDGGVIETGKLVVHSHSKTFSRPITLIGTYNHQGSRADAV